VRSSGLCGNATGHDSGGMPPSPAA
jgi:hypothetical protein